MGKCFSATEVWIVASERFRPQVIDQGSFLCMLTLACVGGFKQNLHSALHVITTD